MKTPRNKSFLSHLLGWISGEASNDMDRVAKKNGRGMVAGMGWRVSHSVFQYLWEQTEQRRER